MKAHLVLSLSLLGAALVCRPALAASQHDQHFLEEAMKGDNSEMMLGQLAEQRGASSGVKAFGRTLHEDHAHAKTEAEPVARKAGVALTDAVTPEAAQERRKLQALHGSAFDQEFARYMVQDHKKDIAKFEQEAHESGAAAQLATKTLPVLRKHLDMAERLNKS